MKDRVPFLVFLASAMALSTMYGVTAARRDWFPNPQVSLALQTLADLRANWKNDLALEPTRHLVPARTPGRPEGFEGFKLYRPEAVTPGYVMIAGLSKEQDRSAFDVVLYDGDGRVVHEWPVDYSVLDPEGLRPLNVMLHGMEVFEDGSLAVTFDAGNALARIDACGQPMWVTRGPFHHSITADDTGGLWAWRNEEIVRLAADSGRETHSLDIRKQILGAGEGQQGVFSIRSFIDGDGKPLRYAVDAFHANDVEPLPADMAPAFPEFAAGDLLISLRELNLLAVIDPEDGRLRWWQHGPWLKQHDPDFQPDGTITVFDNASGSGASRILRVNPADDTVTVAFEGSDDVPFYSWQRGKHQVLPGGNILVTEAEHGRVFEVAPDGGLVWERDMGWDADRNLIVTEARHVAPDFFTDGPPSCALTARAADPA
jgi:hypothetical protein